MWCKFSWRFQDTCPDKELSGTLLRCNGSIHHCPHSFFSVVFILWHNHLTSFVGLYLLCWKLIYVTFSLQGRCKPRAIKLVWIAKVQPILALFECKISLFFSNNNGFIQKSAKSLLISHYLCTFAPDNEPLKQAGGSASGVLWYANHSRMRKWERLPVRNPVFSQSLNLPLYKEFGEIHPKIRKKSE